GCVHENGLAAPRAVQPGARRVVRPGGESRPAVPDDVLGGKRRARGVAWISALPNRAARPGDRMTTVIGSTGAVGRRISLRGVVQGVGFRPFVHRLALRLGLSGWVRNSSGNVQIHIEGAPEKVNDFILAVRSEAPPLARIDDFRSEICDTLELTAFQILESKADPADRQAISPDVALCAPCEAELFDPHDRRYRYPFISCAECGPQLSMKLETAAKLLLDGRIVAMRGLGGFQLAVDATDDHAVARLRARKNREAKPFAVMV